MQIVRNTSFFNIFVVELNKLGQLQKEFLVYICSKGMGIQKNNYWIFNSNLNIYENGDVAVGFINQLLYNTQIRNYTQLMITER